MDANQLLFELERINKEDTLYKNWMQGDDLNQFLESGKNLLSRAQAALAAGNMPYKMFKDVEAAYAQLVRNIKQIKGEEVLTRKQKLFPSKVAGKAMLITASAIDATKKNKKTWYNLAIADKKVDDSALDLTEKQLSDVKKHDVVDVGHKDHECNELTENQLDKSKNNREGDVEEITERQLAEAQVDEEVMILTEGQLDDATAPSVGSRKEGTWQGDDIKIYREINNRQKENARANLAFYKDNPERTEGGKGTVSASWKNNLRSKRGN